MQPTGITTLAIASLLAMTYTSAWGNGVEDDSSGKPTANIHGTFSLAEKAQEESKKIGLEYEFASPWAKHCVVGCDPQDEPDFQVRIALAAAAETETNTVLDKSSRTETIGLKWLDVQFRQPGFTLFFEHALERKRTKTSDATGVLDDTGFDLVYEAKYGVKLPLNDIVTVELARSHDLQKPLAGTDEKGTELSVNVNLVKLFGFAAN